MGSEVDVSACMLGPGRTECMHASIGVIPSTHGHGSRVLPRALKADVRTGNYPLPNLSWFLHHFFTHLTQSPHDPKLPRRASRAWIS